MARKKKAYKSEVAARLIAGRYQEVRSLGRGGGGAVYLVQDRMAGDRPLALKIAAAGEGDTQGMADLKNEFSTLSLLHHPNLAAVYDFGTSDQEMYFTSEWVDGRDLLQVTRQADLNTVFQVLVQVLRALDYLHQRGVLHLDLKPANILVTDPDRTGELKVKVIDFGIAQWKKRGRGQAEGFSGSPPYAAPELMMEKEASPASDIYSLGMLFHQLFAGRFPFSTQNPYEILMRQTYEDPQPVESLDPALPPDFAGLLHRMVARDPASRQQSARELLAELNRSLGEKFSLRSPQAPVHILKESDHLFHPEILADLAARLAKRERIELVGPPGAGKTRLLESLKASLQLQGSRPIYFLKSSDWEEFLRRSKVNRDRPLLLDFSGKPGVCFADVALEAPMVWTREVATAEGSSDSRVLLPALDENKLEKFIQAEIQEAPTELARELTQGTGSILPGKLEKIFQAHREEGALGWGLGGWHWQGELPIDSAALLQRQEIREAENKKQVREFLEGSGLSLPAAVLEGMLGFESGALRDALQDWVGEGWLQTESQKGVAYFGVALDGERTTGIGIDGNTEGVEQQLQSLYEQGKFSAGSAWLERLLQEAGANPLPPRLVLFGARHLVAEGQAERAKILLQDLSFPDSEAAGLLWETRARAENLLGRLEAAEAALHESEQNYLAAGNARGLARVLNLRGMIFRSQRRWEQAEENFTQAVQQADRAGDLYCAGLAQTNLALVFQDQGKIEQAFSGYQRAWDFAKQQPHPFLLQSLYQKWIHLLHHGGRSAEAEAACYEWMKLAIRHHYRDQQAIAWNYLSLIAGKKGHSELKASYLDRALALLDEKKQPRFRAQFLVNRAYLHWSAENFLPAQLDAEAAFKIGKQWPEDRMLGWIYLILGKIYRDRPKPDLAASSDFFTKARDNMVKNQTLESLWELEYNRGLLAKKQENPSQAKAHFQAAKQALDSFLEKLPEPLRASYLRDRKLAAIQQELAE